MDWRNIPSLSALKAFEAAARNGSLTAAARELNVTHAAIAQHVRRLEAHFARSLLRRVGTGMQTTDDGARLADALRRGFEEIAAGVELLSQNETTRSLRITTTPSFAEHWLVPRLVRFWDAHPGIGIDIVPTIDTIDLRRGGFDMALRYGLGDWDGLRSEVLQRAGHTVIVAPGLVDASHVRKLDDVLDKRWFFVEGMTEELFWLQGQGVDTDKLKITTFASSALVMRAVLSGAGISIQPQAVVEEDVTSGRLVALFTAQDSPLAYHIALPPGPISEKTRVFRRWLRSQT